jgi:hypothetical protein
MLQSWEDLLLELAFNIGQFLFTKSLDHVHFYVQALPEREGEGYLKIYQ